MSIRVLHVIGSLRCGGAQVVLKHIVENINDSDVKAYVYPLRSKEIHIPIKGEVITRSYRIYDPRKFFTILRLCKKHDIDILAAHLTKPVIACLFASFFCKAKVVVYEHGPVCEKGLQYTLYRAVLRLLWCRAATFIAVSKHISDYLKRRIGISADRIKVLPNAVDFELFNTNNLSRETSREQLGISEDDIVIGYVGRLQHLKAPDLLVEAAALLFKKPRRYLFLLVGEGAMRNSLEESVRRSGIDDRVRFMGFRDDVPAIMAAFDIGIVPSRMESFGIVCLELMRMKIPVISSGVGGMAEYITDGQNGLLLNDNSPDEICRYVERLVDDAQLRQRLIEGGTKLVEKFSAEKYGKATHQLYEELLHKNY